MKRLLIFTALFPPVALLVFIGADPMWRREPLEMGLLFWMLGFAYPVAVIPAWLTAGLDWALSAKSFYLRVAATMPVAAILAEAIARYLGQRDLILTAGLMGAIPAAVCSSLSTLIQPGKA